MATLRINRLSLKYIYASILLCLAVTVLLMTQKIFGQSGKEALIYSDVPCGTWNVPLP